MIDYQTFCQIKALAKEGLNPLQIAGELNLDPRTVYHWLAQERFRPRKASPRFSKLDSFKGDISRMLAAHPYSAAQIYQRLREFGFEGGYTIVKDYVRKVRPRRKPAFLNPLHHLRQIVALSEIYSPEQVARAMEDAFTYQAFSCEYIANILEQRSRIKSEPQALHLTRREDRPKERPRPAAAHPGRPFPGNQDSGTIPLELA